jgi:hypothetical protein
MSDDPKDWKRKLRYGKVKTEFKHFTALADGVVGNLTSGFECRPGRAWMAMKTWAIDADESADMIQVIGREIGFKVDGRIQIYSTEPTQPPSDKLHGYDIKFTPYDEDDEAESED